MPAGHRGGILCALLDGVGVDVKNAVKHKTWVVGQQTLEDGPHPRPQPTTPILVTPPGLFMGGVSRDGKGGLRPPHRRRTLADQRAPGCRADRSSSVANG